MVLTSCKGSEEEENPPEFEVTPVYNSNYIEGINNLYEFDCGELRAGFTRLMVGCRIMAAVDICFKTAT